MPSTAYRRRVVAFCAHAASMAPVFRSAARLSCAACSGVLWLQVQKALNPGWFSSVDPSELEAAIQSAEKAGASPLELKQARVTLEAESNQAKGGFTRSCCF